MLQRLVRQSLNFDGFGDLEGSQGRTNFRKLFYRKFQPRTVRGLREGTQPIKGARIAPEFRLIVFICDREKIPHTGNSSLLVCVGFKCTNAILMPYHESKYIPRVKVYTKSQSIYHESMFIP